MALSTQNTGAGIRDDETEIGTPLHTLNTPDTVEIGLEPSSPAQESIVHTVEGFRMQREKRIRRVNRAMLGCSMAFIVASTAATVLVSFTKHYNEKIAVGKATEMPVLLTEMEVYPMGTYQYLYSVTFCGKLIGFFIFTSIDMDIDQLLLRPKLFSGLYAVAITLTLCIEFLCFMWVRGFLEYTLGFLVSFCQLVAYPFIRGRTVNSVPTILLPTSTIATGCLGLLLGYALYLILVPHIDVWSDFSPFNICESSWLKERVLRCYLPGPYYPLKLFMSQNEQRAVAGIGWAMVAAICLLAANFVYQSRKIKDRAAFNLLWSAWFVIGVGITSFYMVVASSYPGGISKFYDDGDISGSEFRVLGLLGVILFMVVGPMWLWQRDKMAGLFTRIFVQKMKAEDGAFVAALLSENSARDILATAVVKLRRTKLSSLTLEVLRCE